MAEVSLETQPLVGAGAGKPPFSPLRPSKARRELLKNLAKLKALNDPAAGLSAEEIERRLIHDPAYQITHSKIDQITDEIRSTYFPDVDPDEFRSKVGWDAYDEEKPNPVANTFRRIVERAGDLAGAGAEVHRQARLSRSRTERERFEKRFREKNAEASDEDLDAAWDEEAEFLNELRGKMSTRTDQLLPGNPGGMLLMRSAALKDQSEDKAFVSKLRDLDLGGETFRSLDDTFRSPGDFGLGSVETAAVSLADMALILFWPTLIPYTGLRIAEIALERMEADKREELSATDFIVAAPTAILVSALDKIGLSRLLGRAPTGGPGQNLLFRTRAGTKRSPGAVAGEIAKRLGTETGLEAAQELIEYAATSVGTETGFDPETGAKVSALGAGAGAALAGPVQAVGGGIEARAQLVDAAGAFLTDQEASVLQDMVPEFSRDTGLGPNEAFVAISDAYRIARNLVRQVGRDDYTPDYEDILATHNRAKDLGAQAEAEQVSEEAGDPAPEVATQSVRERVDFPLVRDVETNPDRWDVASKAISDQVAKGARQVLNPVDLVEGQAVVVLQPGEIAPVAGRVVKVGRGTVDRDGEQVEENNYVRVDDEHGESHRIIPHQGRTATTPVFVTPNPERVAEEEKQAEADAQEVDYDSEARRLVQQLRGDAHPDTLKQLEKLRGKTDWFLRLSDNQKAFIDNEIRVAQDKIAALKAKPDEGKPKEPEAKTVAEAGGAEGVLVTPVEPGPAKVEPEPADEGKPRYSVSTPFSRDAAPVEGESAVAVWKQVARTILSEPERFGLDTEFRDIPISVVGEVLNRETGKIERVEEYARDVRYEGPVADEEIDEILQAATADVAVADEEVPFTELDEALAEVEKEYGDIVSEEAKKSGEADEDAGNVGLSRADQAAREDERAAEAAIRAADKQEEPRAIGAGGFVTVPASELILDPTRFQFKRADKTGKTGRLADVEKWNEDAAGTIVAWRDPDDGKLYVVDGHQRVNLAHDLEARGHAPIEITAKVLDGTRITAEEARHRGAMKNIGEGSGTAVDAARVWRASAPAERADLAAAFKHATMRHGMSLAKMTDEVFKLYAGYFNNPPGGRLGLPPELAAAIGEAAPDGTDNAEALQMAMLKDMIADPPATALEAQQFAKDFVAMQTGQTEQAEQQGLFGEELIAESAIRERARIKAGVLRDTKHHARIFGALEKNKQVLESIEGNIIDAAASRKQADQAKLLAAVIEQQSTQAGSPISEVLTQLALEVKAGRLPLHEAINRFRETVIQTLQQVPETGADPTGGRARDRGGEAGAQSAADEIEDLAKQLGITARPKGSDDTLLARASEIEEFEAASVDLGAMSNERFVDHVTGYTAELRHLAAKQKGGTHLTGTETVLLRRLAKLRPLVLAELKRRKEGGAPIERKDDTDLGRAIAFLLSTDDDAGELAGLASEANIEEHIEPDTTALLDRGTEFGIPAAVTQDQAHDAAAIVEAFKSERGGFILALPTGSGKTFVLAAAVRELRKLKTADGKRAVNRIVYLTMSRPLIEQNKRDFAPFLEGVDGVDVDFATYAKVRNPDDEQAQKLLERMVETQGTVLILDEAHTAKGQTTQTTRAIRALMEAADFTIASSATPFTDPKDIHYLEASGAFAPLGGFDEWFKAHGGVITENRTEEGHVYRTYSSEGVSQANIAEARRQMTEAGLFTYRPSRIDPERTAIEFVDTELGELVAPGMQALYTRMFVAGQTAIRSLATDKSRSNASMWLKNKLKRISEQAKIYKAVEIAETTLGPGRNDRPQVIIFTETRSPSSIGEWRLSENVATEKQRMARTYTFPEMEPMQARARAEEGPLPFSPAIFALAQAFYEAGIKAELPSVIDAFREKFGENMVEYHGDVTPEQRRLRQKAFNEGKARILVATIAAGGTGLSLHDVIGEAPRTVVPLSLPWDAISFNQMLGRATRYGMQSDVKITIPYAAVLPIEQTVAMRQAHRAQRMGLLIAGKAPAITSRIADVISGEEEVLPATQAGPLKTYMEGRSNRPRGYSDDQTRLTQAVRRILRLGNRPDTRSIADIGSWLEEVGDGTALTDTERELIEGEGLGAFLRHQRTQAMIAVRRLAEDDQVDEALTVIGDIETYLKTRRTSDYLTHVNDFTIDVKGMEGDSLAKTLRDFASQSERHTTREAIVFHGSPKRGIRKFDNRFVGTGEGFQAYGWGMYFSDPGGVAEWYFDKFKQGAVDLKLAGGVKFLPHDAPWVFRHSVAGNHSILSALRAHLESIDTGTHNLKRALLDIIDVEIAHLDRNVSAANLKRLRAQSPNAADVDADAARYDRVLRYREAVVWAGLGDERVDSYDGSIGKAALGALKIARPALDHQLAKTFAADVEYLLRQHGLAVWPSGSFDIEHMLNEAAWQARGIVAGTGMGDAQSLYRYYAARNAERKQLHRVREHVAHRPNRAFQVRAKRMARGAQYSVEIPDTLDAALGRYDDPVSEQPPDVATALEAIRTEAGVAGDTFGQVLRKLGQDIGDQQASERMLHHGIRGHKYRGGQQGEGFNYVLFDAAGDARILDERNQLLNRNSPAWRYIKNPKVWDSPGDDPAINQGLEDLVLKLAWLNRRLTGGRAALQLERGVFEGNKYGDLALGQFDLRSHVLRIALDPLHGYDPAQVAEALKNPKLRAELDPVRILGHESIHALRAMGAFSKSDWEVLKRAAVAKGWLGKYNIREVYKHYSEEIQYEEAVAHAFSDYLVTHEAKGRLQLLFERIAQFFVGVFSLLRSQGYRTNARTEALFRKVASGANGRNGGNGVVQPPIDDSDPLSELPPEPRRRWLAAREGIEPESLWRRSLAAGADLAAHLTRAFPYIARVADNAELLHMLRLLRGSAAQAGVEVSDMLRQVTEGLTVAQIWTLNDKFVLQDLIWTYEEGMALPFGLSEDWGDGRDPVERLVAMLAKVDALIEADPVLGERLALREKFREELRRELVDAGVLTEQSARNPSYYRHQVLEYAQARGAGFGPDANEKVVTPHVYRRLGSVKDINLNYHQVEGEWMVQAKHDIAVQRFLTWLGESRYNKRPEFAARARGRNEAYGVERLRDELRAAGWKHANDSALDRIGYLADFKRAVKKLGNLPAPDKIPMFMQYSKLAARLVANSTMLAEATEKFLANPGTAIDSIPQFLLDLMERVVSPGYMDENFDDGGDGAFDDFPVFEVASWALRPTTLATPAMRQFAGAFLKAVVARRKLLKAMAGNAFLDTTSTAAIHRGLDTKGEFRTWQPDATNARQIKLTVRTGKALPERIYEQMVATLAEEGDIPAEVVEEWVDRIKDERMLGAPSRMLIIPKGLAATLDRFHPRAVENHYLWMATRVNSALRRWILFMPRRLMGFLLRNTAGDLDAWLANQSIDFRKTLTNELPRAWNMLRDEEKTGKEHPLLADALRYDVLQSGYIQAVAGASDTTEVLPGGELAKDRAASPGNLVGRAVRGYGRLAYSAAKQRENAFRLAVYLHMRESFDAAGIKDSNSATRNAELLRKHVGYGSTPRWAREGLADDPMALVARMARDAMGDYSDITAIGERLDQGVFFFWRWVETNTRRNYNNLINAYTLPMDSWKYDAADKAKMYTGIAEALRLSALLPAKALVRMSYLLTKFATFAALLALASHGLGWAFGRDDEDRPRRGSTIVNPKLTLFHDEERDAYIEMRYQGSVRDALRWVNVDEAWFSGQDAFAGKAPWTDVPKAAAKGLLNVPFGNFNAIYKGLAEVIVGRRTWPDVTRSIEIDDPLEHLARTLALDNEYKLLLGEQDAADYGRSWALSTVGAVSRSAAAERIGADYEAREMADRAKSDPEIKALRKKLRRAVVARNKAQMHKMRIALQGLGEEYSDLAQSVFYGDAAYGASRQTREYILAARRARGEESPSEAFGLLQTFRDYWAANPLTEKEQASVRERREKARARFLRHHHAVERELAEAA